MGAGKTRPGELIPTMELSALHEPLRIPCSSGSLIPTFLCGRSTPESVTLSHHRTNWSWPLAKRSTRPRQSRHPETKIGPFAEGIGVAIWLSTVDDGQKQFRSITSQSWRMRDDPERSFEPGVRFHS